MRITREMKGVMTELVKLKNSLTAVSVLVIHSFQIGGWKHSETRPNRPLAPSCLLIRVLVPGVTIEFPHVTVVYRVFSSD